MVELMTWSPGLGSPKIARLSASVPPLVKTISEARHPSKRGHGFARALDGRPRLLSVVMDGRGVPEVLRRSRACMASKTAGSTGVVALLSR